MLFQTKVLIPVADRLIDHTQGVMLAGSCFAESIGERFARSGFDVDVNPFGILYNPASVGAMLRRLIEERAYVKEELFEYGGLWHSATHHGDFSDEKAEYCLAKINERIVSGGERLRKISHLFVTFGTAWVWEWADGGGIVGNCHRVPDRHFARRRLSVAEIADEWGDLIGKIKIVNPNVNIVFTVSPIRHLGDGAHESQLSKAVLLLAVDELCRRHSDAGYFPAYELAMDELRDYRFYAQDMIHLSDTAKDYIWERFGEVFFSMETRKLACEHVARAKIRAHVPRR